MKGRRTTLPDDMRPCLTTPGYSLWNSLLKLRRNLGKNRAMARQQKITLGEMRSSAGPMPRSSEFLNRKFGKH